MQVTQNMETLALAREFFTGSTDKAMHKEMDRRLADLKAEGHEFVARTRIGSNATCPCGSGMKFKKCCIDKATAV